MDNYNHYGYESLSPANAVISKIEEERNKQNEHSLSDMNKMHQDNSIRRMTDEDEDEIEEIKEQTNSIGVEKVRSRRVDYREKDSLFYTARFLFECGYKLRCSPETIAAAAALFHRFFKECDTQSYDKYLIASTTLYIAGKAYDEKYKIRDVINVSYNTLNRSSTPLDLSDEYWLRRDAIVQAELLIMRMLCFDVTYDYPHKYLLHYFTTLKSWLPHPTWETVPLIQASYGFLQDYHHDASVISHKPQHIAIACIHLAFLCYGVDLPNFVETENRTWYHAFSPELTDDKLSIIIDSVIDVYDHCPLTIAFEQSLERASCQLRHLDYIGQLTTDIRYITGEENKVGNVISRMPLVSTITINDVGFFMEVSKAQEEDDELKRLRAGQTSPHGNSVPVLPRTNPERPNVSHALQMNLWRLLKRE